jgi:hypothetical protein
MAMVGGKITRFGIPNPPPAWHRLCLLIFKEINLFLTSLFGAEFRLAVRQPKLVGVGLGNDFI